MATAANTALVLKNITRCEWGTMDKGLIAETFDRVTVTKVFSWSNGGRGYSCVTDSGEKFHASTGMVQMD